MGARKPCPPSSPLTRSFGCLTPWPRLRCLNLDDLKAPRFDPVTQEKLHVLFGIVTTKGPDKEVQLAKLLKVRFEKK